MLINERSYAPKEAVMTLLLRVAAFLSGLFGVLSMLAAIGVWEDPEVGVFWSLNLLTAGIFALMTAFALQKKVRQRVRNMPTPTAISPKPRKTLRGAFTAVVIIVVAVAVFDWLFPSEQDGSGESLSASAQVSFASYALAELGTSTGRCDDAAERETRITWICGDYTRGYSAFIANWEDLTASASFREQYTLTPESDWLYYEHDDGRPDFYGRFFRLNGEMFLASYNVEDNPGEGDRIFLGFGEPLARMPALATRAVSRE
jgi:hypothetical protein